MRAATAWLHYVAAALLVAVYINTFELWVWLSDRLGGGRARLIPFIVTALVAIWVAAETRRQLRSGGRPTLWPLAVAALAAVAGLLLPDSEFPAKRIHVPQYALLALVVRRGLASRLDGAALWIVVAVAGALYGVHDELIQGFHPKRTFGWPDMVANALGALAGSLAAHSLGLFRPARIMPAPRHARSLLLALVGALAVYPLLAVTTDLAFR